MSRPLCPPGDANGFDLRPDPMLARTPTELMDAVRHYRIWAGEPSFRQIAQRSSRAVAASTICVVLKTDGMPRLETVLAIVAGCGGDEAYQRRFATAWRAIRSGQSLPGAA